LSFPLPLPLQANKAREIKRGTTRRLNMSWGRRGEMKRRKGRKGMRWGGVQWEHTIDLDRKK
jgi:hypothetical protein